MSKYEFFIRLSKSSGYGKQLFFIQYGKVVMQDKGILGTNEMHISGQQN